MRLLLIRKQTDLKALQTLLLRPAQEEHADALTMERLRTLNPHLDLQRLTPGTVLVVPNTPMARDDVGELAGEDDFELLREQVVASVSEARDRVLSGLKARQSERSAVAKAIKSSEFEAALKLDPALQANVERAAALAEEDEARTKQTAEQLDGALQRARDELSALRKLLF